MPGVYSKQYHMRPRCTQVHGKHNRCAKRLGVRRHDAALITVIAHSKGSAHFRSNLSCTVAHPVTHENNLGCATSATLLLV